MANKRLMMVGGWTEIYAKAKACGFDLTVFQDKSDISPADFALIDQLITAKRDEPVLVELADALHRARPFDGVVSFQEIGVMAAGLIGERLGVLANPLAPVLLTRDKGRMRAHMEAARVPSIPYTVATCASDVLVFGQNVGWPVILKPADGSGSRQIHKLTGEQDVGPAFDALRAHYPEANPIVEKFVEGPEVSIEAVSWNGKHTILGVTDKITTGAPYFVETGHNMPSELPPATLDAIHQLTEQFLTSIGHLHGPSHTEVIVAAGRPVIVESHTRTGGDRIYEMVEHAYGVDMFTATLQGFAGDASQVTPKKPSGAAIRYITLPEGKVTAIAGVDEASRAGGVIRFELKLEVGQQVKEFTNSAERHGFILAVGADLQQAIANADAARAQLHITVEPA